MNWLWVLGLAAALLAVGAFVGRGGYPFGAGRLAESSAADRPPPQTRRSRAHRWLALGLAAAFGLALVWIPSFAELVSPGPPPQETLASPFQEAQEAGSKSPHGPFGPIATKCAACHRHVNLSYLVRSSRTFLL